MGQPSIHQRTDTKDEVNRTKDREEQEAPDKSESHVFDVTLSITTIEDIGNATLELWLMNLINNDGWLIARDIDAKEVR